MPTKTKFHFLIVTPSYNQGQYLEQTISSVLEQKGNFDLSYWVMDGGSTDNSSNILKKYKSKLNYLSEQDQGQANAINKAIGKFKKIKKKKDTRYIFAYINSDDYYLEKTFATVIKYFKKSKNKYWLAGAYQVESNKNKLIHQLIANLWKQFLLFLYKIFGLNLLYVVNPLAQPAIFIDWQAIETIGFFNENLKYTLDYQYWLRLHQQFKAPIIINQVLAKFRIHPQSKGGKLYHQQFTEQFSVAKQYCSNPLLLLIHKIHNFFTVKIYQLIK